ncbi:MAG: hypothetical protein NTX50_29975 [Candidatus Sumerlaeota bacterium]|nr:hypothetical protein [Candidatus Sumerlaeota bacterium]
MESVGQAITRRVAERLRTTPLGLLWHRLHGSPVPPPDHIKRYWLRRFARRYSISTFIESGTYVGHTVETMLPCCSIIHTIELSDKLWKEATLKFLLKPGVQVHHGDSGAALPKILAGISERCLFWLDGHYSAGLTARGDSNTPIARELAAIAAHSRNDHVILIDDARQFDGTQDYPSREALFEMLRRINPAYRIRLVDDMFQAYPRP